jgi:large subunit ribosomal protein L21
MLGEGEGAKIGTPVVQGAKVEVEITEQGKNKKVLVFRFKQRKKFRKKYGHRQPYTELKVTDILG